jgi:hypothetical protein
VAGYCEHGNEHLGFIRTMRNLAECLLASQEGLWCMELVDQ